jgi:pyruvate/2-oxoglutarate dehydrogenase complex dihydrolipoamide acyltransferase (E2) component
MIGRSPVEYWQDDSIQGVLMAVHDILGQASGMSVARLLSPSPKTRIEHTWWTHCLPPDLMAAEAKLGASLGYRVHKVKARSWQDPLAQAAAMCAVVPKEYRFWADANSNWGSPSRALHFINGLARHPNYFAVESPVQYRNVDSFRELKGKSPLKIAEHMVMSKRTSAHVTTIHRVDMTKVAKMRERHKAQYQSNYGFSLTYLPFITRACVAALREFPLLNASLDNNNIIYHNEINIGIAVALENGLIVPVIRTADEKNILGLQRAIVDLAARARSRQLKPDEVQGGTFSITNFGSFGSLVGTPVINQPQVAILGVGTVDKTPVVIDDAIAIRSICHLSLSFDHRLIDGALADQFMTKVKHVLEGWSEEVL